MSKKRKSKKKKGSRPNLSPLSVLRPRLDGLFGNPDWGASETSAISADLAAVTKGVAANDYLPVLIKAYQAAPDAAQVRVDGAMPAWLQETDQVETLSQLLTDFAFDSEDQPVALRWMEATGTDISSLELTRESTFYTAFLGKDDMGSQGLFHLFYYCNRQRDRVKGFNLLLDFNPPWDGSAKDCLPYPQRRPKLAVKEFVHERPGGDMIENEELDATAAKKTLLEIFACNQAEGISLHKDIVRLRDVFEQHVVTLPDDPDTPPFTIADFDALGQLEKTSEALSIHEKTFGRRIRGEDGKEIVILGADDFDDDEW